MKMDPLFLRFFMSRRKTVRKNTHNVRYYCLSFIMQSPSRIQRAASRGNKVFYENNMLSWFEITLNLLLFAMFLRFCSHIDKWEIQSVSAECPPSNPRCRSPRNDIWLDVEIPHTITQSLHNECPRFRVTEDHTV